MEHMDTEPLPATKEEYGRVRRMLRSKSAEWTLAALSFFESTFLPIIIDPFIVMMTLAHPRRWKRYSIIAAAASVFGGVAGYVLGVFFFAIVGERIIAFYSLEDEFARTVALFDGNIFWITLIGAVTPIPYKIFALVGGFMHVSLVPFVLASIVGRFGRFLLVGYVTYRFGDHALRLFSRRFNYVAAALIFFAMLYTMRAFI